MTAKEYLSRAATLDKEINRKLGLVEKYRAMTQQITARFNKDIVDRSRNVTSLQTTIAKLVDAENEMNRQIDELVDLKLDVDITICRIGDEVQRMILEKRYLDFESWDKIAAETNYAKSSLMRKHAEALTEVDRILREREAAE